MGFTKVMKQPAEKHKIISKLFLYVIFIGFLAGALSIPFYFETMTLWYKTGADKAMLRGGQLAGMLTMVLLLLQIILAVRGQYLEKLFGTTIMTRLHRTNGIAILLSAVCHVILVLAPEGLANLPIGKKYWPELIGVVLLLIVSFIVVTSYFRQRLRIKYKLWRTIHKSLGYLVIILLLGHVLFVSESFEHVQLRAFLIFLFGALSLWIINSKILSGFDK